MKNKLLVTTALVGLVASGSAFAETKITGGLKLSYSGTSEKAQGASKNGFGRESQINFTNTGDLNNGLKYATGFSLEFDGNESTTTNTLGATSAANENVYFDVISGATTISFGIDHAPNVSASATPRVAEQASSTFGSLQSGSQKQIGYTYNPGGGVDSAFQIAVIQNTSVGKFSVGYIPDNSDKGSAGDTGSDLGANGKSAYNVIYTGDAGIKGLKIQAAYQKEDGRENVNFQDGKVIQYGVGYNFGKYAAGVTVNDWDSGTAGTDNKSVEYGVTAAITDKISLGALYILTDGTTSGVSYVNKEELMIGTVAYNMGPATVSFSYGRADNLKGAVSANDTEVGTVRLVTAF